MWVYMYTIYVCVCVCVNVCIHVSATVAETVATDCEVTVCCHGNRAEAPALYGQAGSKFCGIVRRISLTRHCALCLGVAYLLVGVGAPEDISIVSFMLLATGFG